MGLERRLKGRDEELKLIEREASIMASATPSCFCTTQKHLAVKRSRSSMA